MHGLCFHVVCTHSVESARHQLSIDRYLSTDLTETWIDLDSVYYQYTKV